MLASAMLLASAGGVGAETLQFAAARDNTLYEDASGRLSNGRGVYLFAGKTAGRADGALRRGVIAFDVSAIPRGATVTSATLELFDSSPSGVGATVTLHRVTQNWGEGTSDAGSPGGNGAAAAPGDATWLHTFFSNMRWAAAGGDFIQAASSSVVINGSSRTYAWMGSGLRDDVQGWVRDPATNFGWMIRGNETSGGTAQRFNSRENSLNPPRLTVVYTAPAASTDRLLNVSTRVRVGAGEEALIGGFILAGAGEKRVALRAIGPSLAARNVPQPLADPMIELVADQRTIQTNDNWREGSAAAELQTLGLAPGDDREAALIASLPAAQYTAVVSGRESGTGVALVEVYDLNREADVRLANLSTRGRVRTGDEVMIGGFIIGGDSAAQIIVRAIGPSLAASGVMQVLADPTLQLFDANGEQVASNNDWQDDSAQADQLRAKGFEPKDPRESAIVSSLAAGQYTAIVSGNGGGTGIALVELYHLPR